MNSIKEDASGALTNLKSKLYLPDYRWSYIFNFIGLSGSTVNSWCAHNSPRANIWVGPYGCYFPFSFIVGLFSASGATGQLIFLLLFAIVLSSYSWQAVVWVTTAAALAVV
ncbi:MAG: hypothetical protein M0T74_14655 [Desulfitobacterium hafniense]|nr:hypothetical protein [Desulfitobacterium hafniense]